MNSIATAISNGRTDTSFVDDLNALRGTVNSRVALLLRSIEVHPLQLRCVVLSRTHPSTFPFSGTTAHAGVFDMAAGAQRCYIRLCANSLKKYQSQANETAEGCARSLPSLPPLAKKQKRDDHRPPRQRSLIHVTSLVASRGPRRSSCRSRTRGCFRLGQKRTGRKSQSIAIRARARLASPRATRVRERENEL